MRFISLVLLSVSVSFAHADVFSSQEVQEWTKSAIERCAPSEHPPIYQSDFKWGMNFLEAAEAFGKMYISPQRLQHRIHAKNNTFFGRYAAAGDDLVNVPVRFLYSIKKHIESALALEYAQWVIFPDMGHNHFFVDLKEYKELGDVSHKERMEKMISSSKTKVLYHTLEQIKAMGEDKKLIDDAWTQWRYYTRNIVGDNQGKGTLEIHKKLDEGYNTVGNPPEGYRYWGAGVNVSSNEKGCFSYKHQGRVFHFDVSFYDLAYQSAGDDAAGDEF